jgi:colanic acid/amylovoran biosynthesis glycosyltransferase
MRPQPRLAYLVSRYPTVSHTFILREVKCLREEGFEIHLASINDPDRPYERLTPEERDDALATYYVKRAGVGGAAAAHVVTVLSAPMAYLRGLQAALRLAGANLAAVPKHLGYFLEAVMIGRWMRRHGLKHLHVHFATPAATVALIATHVFDIDMSMTVHGPDEFDDVRGYHLAEKIAASRFVCCISAYARSQLMKQSSIDLWSRFEVAPLGVDPAVFSPAGRPRSETFEIICVGRLVPAKGQAILIAAVEHLLRAGQRVRLRLVGDGPDRHALEHMVAERGLGDAVVFDGAIDPDGIRARYAAADAFALASFAEGVPVVLMEAMAMELPVVATAITGIPELIRHGIDGLLVPPSDEGAMAGALARLIDSPDLCVALGLAGRRRVIDRFNLRPNVTYLAEIFRRRLRSAGPARELDTPQAAALPARERVA